MDDLVALIDGLDLGEEQRAALLEKARSTYSGDGRKKIKLSGYAGDDWHRSGRWTLEVDTGEGYDGHHELVLEDLEHERAGMARFRARMDAPLGVALSHRRLEFTVKRDGKTVYRENQTKMWLSIREYPFRVIKVDHASDKTNLSVSNVAFELRRRCGAQFWTMDDVSVELCYSDAPCSTDEGEEYVDSLNWKRRITPYMLSDELALLTFEADDDEEHARFFADNLPIFHTLMEVPHICERRWRIYAAVASQLVRFSEETRSAADANYRHSAWRRTYVPEIRFDESHVALIREMRGACFLPEECSESYYEAIVEYHAEESSGACQLELERIEAHAKLVRRCLGRTLSELGPWCVVWDRKRRAPWTPATYDTDGAGIEMCVLNTAQALVWLDEHGDSIPPISSGACSYMSATLAGERIVGKCLFSDAERTVIDVFRVGERYCAPSAPVELPSGEAFEVQSVYANPGASIREELEAYVEHCHHPSVHEPPQLESRTRFLQTASFSARRDPAKVDPTPDQATAEKVRAAAGSLAYDVEGRGWHMFRVAEGSSPTDLLDLQSLQSQSSKDLDPNDTRLWVVDSVPRPNWLEIKRSVLEAGGQRIVSETVNGAKRVGILRDLQPKPAPTFVFQGREDSRYPVFQEDADGAEWLLANDLTTSTRNAVRMYRFRDSRFRIHEGLAGVQSVSQLDGKVLYRIFTHNGAWVYGSPDPLPLWARERSRMWLSKLPGPLENLHFGPPEQAAAPIYFDAREPGKSGKLYKARLDTLKSSAFSVPPDPDGEVDFRTALSYSRSSGEQEPAASDDESSTFELRGLPTAGVGALAAAVIRESAGSFAVPSSDAWDALQSLEGMRADGALHQASAILALLVDRAFRIKGLNRCYRISPKSRATAVAGKVLLRLFDNLGRQILTKPDSFIDDPSEISAVRFEYNRELTLDADTGVVSDAAPVGLWYDTTSSGRAYEIVLDSGRKVLEAQLVTVDDARGVLLKARDLLAYVHPFDLLRSASAKAPPGASPPPIPLPDKRPSLDSFLEYKSDGLSFYGVPFSDGLSRVFCYAREGLVPEHLVAYVPIDKTAPAPAAMAPALRGLHEIYHGKFATHEFGAIRTMRSRWAEWISQGFEHPPRAEPPAPAPPPEPAVTAPVTGEFYLSGRATWLASSPGKGFQVTDAEGNWRMRGLIPETAAAPKTGSLDQADLQALSTGDGVIYLRVDDAADPRLLVYEATLPLSNAAPIRLFKKAMPKIDDGYGYAFERPVAGAESLLDALALPAGKRLELHRPKGLGFPFLFAVPPKRNSKVPLVSNSTFQAAIYYKAPASDRVWAFYREPSADEPSLGLYVGGKMLDEEESRGLLLRGERVFRVEQLNGFRAGGYVFGNRKERAAPSFSPGGPVVAREGLLEAKNAAPLGSHDLPSDVDLTKFDVFVSDRVFYASRDTDVDLMQLNRRIMVAIAGPDFSFTYFTVEGGELGNVYKDPKGVPQIAFVSGMPGPTLAQLATVDVVSARRDDVKVGGIRTFVEPGELPKAVRARVAPPPPPAPAPDKTPPPVPPAPKPAPKEPPTGFAWVLPGPGDFPRILVRGRVAIWQEEQGGLRPKFYPGLRDKGMPAGRTSPASRAQLSAAYPGEVSINTGPPRTAAVLLSESMHYLKSATARFAASGELRFDVELEGDFERRYRTQGAVFGVYGYSGSMADKPDLRGEDIDEAVLGGSAVFVETALAYGAVKELLESKVRFLWREGNGERALLYHGQILRDSGTSEKAPDDTLEYEAFVPGAARVRPGDPFDPNDPGDPDESALLSRANLRVREFVDRFPADVVSYEGQLFGYPTKIVYDRDGRLMASARAVGLEERAVAAEFQSDLSADMRFRPADALSQQELDALLLAVGSRTRGPMATVFDPKDNSLAAWDVKAPSARLEFVSTDRAQSAFKLLDPKTVLRLRNFWATQFGLIKRCVQRSLVLVTDDDDLNINADGTFSMRGRRSLPISQLWTAGATRSGPSPVPPARDELEVALDRYILKRRTMAVVRLKSGERLALGNLSAGQAQILYRSASPWRSAGYQGAWWPIEMNEVATRQSGSLDVGPILEDDLRQIVADLVANQPSPFISSGGRVYQLAYLASRIGAAKEDPLEVLYVISNTDYKKSENAASCSDTLDAARATVDRGSRRARIERGHIVSVRELAFVVGRDSSEPGFFAPEAAGVRALLDAVESGANDSLDFPRPEELQEASGRGPRSTPRPNKLPVVPALATVKEPYNATVTGYVRGPLKLPSAYVPSASQPFSVSLSIPSSASRTISFARFQRYSGPGLLYLASEPIGDAAIYFASGPLVVALSAPKVGARRMKLYYNLSPEIFSDHSYTQVQMTFSSPDLLSNRDYASRVLFERDPKTRLWRASSVVVSVRAIYR